MAIWTPQTGDNIDWMCPVNWQHPLNRGLVGWWLAVQNQGGWKSNRWLDLTDPVSGHHGTLTNMDPATDWRTDSNAVHSSLDFITDDFVNIGGVWDEVIVPANAFSCVAYVNARSTAADGTVWGINDSSGHLLFNDTGTWRSFTAGAPSTSSAAGGVVVDTWQVIGESVGGSSATVYVGGSQLATASGAVSLTTESSDTVIGSGNNSSARPFNGRIASVMIWKRSLSAGEHSFVNSEVLSGFPNLLNRAPRRYYFVSAAVAAVSPRAHLYGPFAGPLRGAV